MGFGALLYNARPASSPLERSIMGLRSVFSFHGTGVATPYIRQVGRFHPITQKLYTVQTKSDKNIIGVWTVVHLHPSAASTEMYRRRNKHFFAGR